LILFFFLVLTFFNLCDIKSLSSSITIEHIIENPSNGIAIQNLLSPLIPYIQLFMKSRSEFVDAYQWTKTINMSSILLNIQFQIVDYLQLIYRLKSDLSICIIQEEKSYYDKNQMIFYIHREWIEQSKHYRDIFHSFARIFIPNYNHQLIRLLANFINLLYNEEENNLEIFAKYQHFDLEFKDLNDSPWQISSTLKPIQYFQPKIGKKNIFFRIKMIEGYTSPLFSRFPDLEDGKSDQIEIFITDRPPKITRHVFEEKFFKGHSHCFL